MIRGDQTISDPKGDIVFVSFLGFSKKAISNQILNKIKDSVDFCIETTSPFCHSYEKSFLIGDPSKKELILSRPYSTTLNYD